MCIRDSSRAYDVVLNGVEIGGGSIRIHREDIQNKVFRLLKLTKEEIESSDWTSCCKGPVLKKDLEDNLWVCDACGKHHRIGCKQRFDIVFGKNNYEILETPIPQDDPLNWKDSKTYK